VVDRKMTFPSIHGETELFRTELRGVLSDPMYEPWSFEDTSFEDRNSLDGSSFSESSGTCQNEDVSRDELGFLTSKLKAFWRGICQNEDVPRDELGFLSAKLKEFWRERVFGRENLSEEILTSHLSEGPPRCGQARCGQARGSSTSDVPRKGVDEISQEKSPPVFAKVDSVGEKRRSVMGDFMGGVEMVARRVRLFRELRRRGVRIFIVSNGFLSVVLPLLAATGLLQFVDSVIGRASSPEEEEEDVVESSLVPMVEEKIRDGADICPMYAADLRGHTHTSRDGTSSRDNCSSHTTAANEGFVADFFDLLWDWGHTGTTGTSSGTSPGITQRENPWVLEAPRAKRLRESKEADRALICDRLFKSLSDEPPRFPTSGGDPELLLVDDDPSNIREVRTSRPRESAASRDHPSEKESLCSPNTHGIVNIPVKKIFTLQVGKKRAQGETDDDGNARVRRDWGISPTDALDIIGFADGEASGSTELSLNLHEKFRSRRRAAWSASGAIKEEVRAESAKPLLGECCPAVAGDEENCVEIVGDVSSPAAGGNHHADKTAEIIHADQAPTSAAATRCTRSQERSTSCTRTRCNT